MIRTFFILSMIETTSKGSFNLGQTKCTKHGSIEQRGREWPKDPKLGLQSVIQLLVQLWSDERKQLTAFLGVEAEHHKPL